MLASSSFESSLRQRHAGAVALGDHHRGAVVAHVHQHHALAEGAGGGLLPVEGLLDHQFVLRGELARFQGPDFGYAAERFEAQTHRIDHLAGTYARQHQKQQAEQGQTFHHR